MFMSQSVAYAALEEMRRGAESEDDVLNLSKTFRSLGSRAGSPDSSKDSEGFHASVLGRWKTLVTGTLDRVRLKLATEAEDGKMDHRGLPQTEVGRRVSYIEPIERIQSSRSASPGSVPLSPLKEG